MPSLKHKHSANRRWSARIAASVPAAVRPRHHRPRRPETASLLSSSSAGIVAPPTCRTALCPGYGTPPHRHTAAAAASPSHRRFSPKRSISPPSSLSTLAGRACISHVFPLPERTGASADGTAAGAVLLLPTTPGGGRRKVSRPTATRRSTIGGGGGAWGCVCTQFQARHWRCL